MKTVLLASVAALALPAAALAQNATPTAKPVATSAADAAPAQGEIVITATRRSQVLSDVPIAVSAVSAEQLKYSGGSDIRQLNQLAPSLLVSSATNDSSAAARIRGIGTVGENPGLESSVAVFIDGVYRSRTGVGLTELGEIERVEVLRGPQGTLFGRNASAGLINIITAKPKFDTGGTAEASYGNFNAIRVGGSVTGPIAGDKLAARLDGVYNKRDGFLPDVISGRKTQNRDRYLIRGQLLFQPSDDLSIRLIGDYSHKNEECCAAAFIEPIQNLTRDASGNVTPGPNTLIAVERLLGAIIPEPTDGSKFARQTSITPGSGYHQKTRDMGFSGEINWNLGGANLTSISAYRNYKNDGQQDGDFNNLDILKRQDLYREFRTYTQELRLQGKAFDNRLDYLVGAYYANERLTLKDDLKFGADTERFGQCLFAESFSRSLGIPSLIQTSDSSCFNRAVARTIPSATIQGLAGTSSFFSTALPPADARGGYANLAATIGYVPPAGANLINGTGLNDTFIQKSVNYAFFTHNVISIVPDKLLLTLGARYTHEQKELDTTFIHTNTFCTALRTTLGGALAGLGGIPCAINGTAGPGFTHSAPGATKSEHRVTGTAVLSFKPVDELLTYASYSRGYKAGGFNLDTAALTPAAPSPFDLQFAPEIVNAYELGAKLNLHQFKLNAAVFLERFQDFQLNLFNGTNFQVTNIESCKDSLNGADTDTSGTTGTCAAGHSKAGVTSKGVELEAFLYPTRDIQFTAGFTVADTKYAHNLTAVNGAALGAGLFQLPGSRLSNSSLYTVTGSAAWTPQINETLSALAYVDFRYQSGLNTGSDLDYEKIQQGFAVVNARIGIYGPDRKWGLEFWSQNLLNEKYQQIAADAPAQGSGTLRGAQDGRTPSVNQLYITFPAEPRTFGVTVRTKF